MISIIIPTYNEKSNIRKLTSKIYEIFKKKKIKGEIIFVDDNSPDGTGKIAEKLSNKYPVRVLHRKKKLGLASAVIEGFSEAKGNILGVMDADLSHPPESIPDMIQPISKGKADFTIGSRYVHDGDIEGWPLTRKIISKSATILTRHLTDVKDPMSGFFFLKKKVIDNIYLSAKGYKICLEIIVKGNYKNIKEVPITFKDRHKGTSKLNKGEYFNYIYNVANLSIYNYFRRKL
jgi:dolichol-phosphate mannosyltransferase